jgi:hypothetical protein
MSVPVSSVPGEVHSVPDASSSKPDLYTTTSDVIDLTELEDSVHQDLPSAADPSRRQREVEGEDVDGNGNLRKRRRVSEDKGLPLTSDAKNIGSVPMSMKPNEATQNGQDSSGIPAEPLHPGGPGEDYVSQQSHNKIDVSHVGLIYLVEGDNMQCRMCL